MPRYIDVENYCKTICRCNGEACDKSKCPIWNAPIADVEPVRHGRWEWHEEQYGNPLDGYEIDWGWCCSNCKTELSDDYDDPDKRPTMRYCHICGAKMDGESEVEDDA